MVDYYAGGGFGKEKHVAQIARAGDWRVWAEPETGGEAYIPMAKAKRPRSEAILAEVAKRFGMDLVEYAAGGIALPPDFETIINAARPQPWAASRAIYEIAEQLMAGPPLGSGVGWQPLWGALSARFPDARLHSAFRPGAITATGRPSYHEMGRAIDVSPRPDIFEWIRANYKDPTRELIFSPMGGRQVHNGRDHMYTGITRANHWDHIHWTMRQGGILNPWIRDFGGPLRPGYSYNGTGHDERVVPDNRYGTNSPGGRGSVVVNAPVTVTVEARVAADVDVDSLGRRITSMVKDGVGEAFGELEREIIARPDF